MGVNLLSHLRLCPHWPDEQHGGHPEYFKTVERLLRMHIEKSGGYGRPGSPFGNFEAVAALSGLPPFYYPALRAMEKLTRWMSLYDQGRYRELSEENLDIASLMLCCEVLLNEPQS